MRAGITKNEESCSLVFQVRTVAKPEPANGKTVFRFEDAIVRRSGQTAQQCPDNGRVLGGSGAGNERLDARGIPMLDCCTRTPGITRRYERKRSRKEIDVVGAVETSECGRIWSNRSERSGKAVGAKGVVVGVARGGRRRGVGGRGRLQVVCWRCRGGRPSAGRRRRRW
jgi:hypothetical protein